MAGKRGGQFHQSSCICASASIATLIRVKFLADLGELDDILCMCRIPPLLHARSCRIWFNILPVDGTDAMVWTLVEPGIAIVAASLVTIRPLLRLLKLRGFGSTGGTFGYKSGTARSGTHNSRGLMPAGGPGDIKMNDIETGSQKPLPSVPESREPSASGKIISPPFMSPLAMSPFNPSAPGLPPTFDDGTRRRMEPELNENGFLPPPTSRWRQDVHSEMYVIEGATDNGPRTPGRSRSPSLSSIDMIGMEAHSQHIGHHHGGRGNMI